MNKYKGKSKWQVIMRTHGGCGPTLARIPILNGIHLLQSQIYGNPNVLDGL